MIELQDCIDGIFSGLKLPEKFSLIRYENISERKINKQAKDCFTALFQTIIDYLGERRSLEVHMLTTAEGLTVVFRGYPAVPEKEVVHLDTGYNDKQTSLLEFMESSNMTRTFRNTRKSVENMGGEISTLYHLPNKLTTTVITIPLS